MLIYKSVNALFDRPQDEAEENEAKAKRSNPGMRKIKTALGLRRKQIDDVDGDDDDDDDDGSAEK